MKNFRPKMRFGKVYSPFNVANAQQVIPAHQELELLVSRHLATTKTHHKKQFATSGGDQ